MSRFIEGEERSQSVLFPERLEDWVAEDNPVRVIEAFVEEMDFGVLGFERNLPASTGCPGYNRPRCSRSTFSAPGDRQEVRGASPPR